MSTLLLIPWIVVGFVLFKDKKFLGLNQNKISLMLLLIVELIYFFTLLFLLGDKEPNCAGCGSFAWMNYLMYEKGILPAFGLAELINPHGGDYIDNNYPIVYFLTALLVDYILLFLISPWTISRRQTKKTINQ